MSKDNRQNSNGAAKKNGNGIGHNFKNDGQHFKSTATFGL